jgi:hemerythrin-like metal-binding protein
MMEEWAAHADFAHAAFICINVDEPRSAALVAAQQFSKELRLAKCHTGYFEHGQPRFGQLGCSGFIVCQPDGIIIYERTPAFLQYRENAFLWMQSFLRSIRPAEEAPLVTQMARGQSNDSNIKVATHQHVKPLEESSGSFAQLGIASMDEEHEECFELLEAILSLSGNKIELKQHFQDLYSHLQEHFDHEEYLMHQSHFGGGRTGPGFTGHHLDHERILDMVLSVVHTTEHEGTAAGTPQHVIAAFVTQVREALAQHISNYDSLYVSDFRTAGLE